MPIDVAISGNSFSWTLQKADLGVNESVATAVGGGLSVMNMAIARGALLASDYAARMMKQTQAVADDVESLKSMQGLLSDLNSWTATEWTDGVARTQRLAAAGLNLSGMYDRALFSADVLTSPTTWKQEVLDLAYPPTPANDGTPYLDVSTGTSGLTSYYVDGSGNTFTRQRWGANSTPWTMYGGVQSTYVGAPSDAELTDLKNQLQRRIESMTQISQSKQAFLQDLMSNYNKFLMFAGNNADRRNRDLQDMLGRF